MRIPKLLKQIGEHFLRAGLTCAVALVFNGCATPGMPVLKYEIGESVVFIGDQPASLAWLPAGRHAIRVRNTYLPSTNTLYYAEGTDYSVDYTNGTVTRMAGSHLPDFRTNILYGQENFDHSQFPGYGNDRFLVYADYSLGEVVSWPVQPPQTQFLSQTRAKLERGGLVKIVAFGDSITAGYNISNPGDIFWVRWVDDLKRRYPKAQIMALNRATAGDTTGMGLQRLKAKVIDEHPDLVLIGFGMNDHNVKGFGTPVDDFEQNLEAMVARVRQETSAEIVLYSAFPPNPKWKFGSHHMADYAAATDRVARRLSCAYADVFDNWQQLAARKKPEDLLANDINHPNDFGHWIYYRVFCGLGL
jgi:acyl-CoA thioesterase-1